MREKHFWMVGTLWAVAVGLFAFSAPQVAWGQDDTLVERLFRTHLTSVTPVFAPGQDGNPDAVIGWNTESTVFEIQEPIENGVIPRPRQSDAEPIGRMFGELRTIGDARLDKSKPMQVLAGHARFVGRGMKFEARGTSIIHWGQDDSGSYNGVRWTDFSGAIQNVEGRHQGAKGHLVGTRLLVGDPEIRSQSGLIIVRLLR